MYQPVSPSSDPVPPSTDRYRLLLTQYHHISTSTAPYWHSTTKYQSIPTYNDPVPSYINQYRLLLTQYHQVPTSTTSYWPSTTKYQPLPLSTDPVPSYIKQYHSIPTQYQQVSTSTPPFCCYSRTADSCTVYPGSCLSKLSQLLSPTLATVYFTRIKTTINQMCWDINVCYDDNMFIANLMTMWEPFYCSNNHPW